MKLKGLLKSTIVLFVFFICSLSTTAANIFTTDCSSALSGWTYTNNGGSAIQQTPSNPYWLIDAQSEYIISQTFNLSGYTGLSLTFKVATFGAGTPNQPLYVELSNDGGATWTAANFTSSTPTSTTFVSSTWNISNTFAVNNVKFRWSRPAIGRAVRLDDISLDGTVAATPAITLDHTNMPQTTANNQARGTGDVILSRFRADVTSAAGELNSLAFNAGGTFLAGDISNFELWYGTSTSFASASSIKSVTATSIANGGTVTFGSLTQSLPVGANYFWITADIASSAVGGRTVSVPALANTAFTFASGTKSGSVTAGGVVTIVGPEIDVLDPASVSIPSGGSYTGFSTTVGTPQDLGFEIHNTASNTALNLTANPRVAISGPGASNFSVLSQPAAVISGGALSTFYIRYNPSAAGASGNATVTIVNDDSNEGNYTFTISGNATTPITPEINVRIAGSTVQDGNSYNVPFTLVNGSRVISFEIENTGQSTLNLTGSPIVVKSGTHASEYTISQPSSNTVAPNSSVTFTITFAPLAAGSRTASISIANNDSDENPYNIDLNGTATIPDINVDRAANNGSYNMGTANVGSPINTVFTIQQLGTGWMTLTGSPIVQISGTNAADFSVDLTGTQSFIVAGNTTTFTVTFTPSAGGSRTATLTIASDDPDENPYTITLTGTGTPACVAPAQATGLSLGSITSSQVGGTFSGSANGYLVVRSTSSTLSASPVNGTPYTAGQSLGGGTVVAAGTGTSFTATGLNPSTQYYFFVFAYTSNGTCFGGPVYATPALTGSATTLTAPYVMFDNFNRTDNTTVGIPSSGGSTPWTETEPLTTQAEIYNNRLDINNRNPAGQAYVSFNMSGKYSTVFDNASAELIWYFNMVHTRPDPSGFGASNYGAAYVLGSTSSNFATSGNGYAVVHGESNSNDDIRLVRFTNGLMGTLTDVIQDGVDYGDNMLSVYVSFNTTTNTWKLAVKNEGVPSSVSFNMPDPSTASYSTTNTAIDATYITSDLMYSGGFWNYATSSGEYASFDNLYIPTAQANNQTYTWVKTTGTWDFTTASNWTPARNTPSSTDILVFNQGGSSIATNVPTQTVGQITVSGNTTIAFRPQTGATRTLSIQGFTGTDFSVATGSQVVYDGNDALEISLLTGATASINGTITMQNTPGSGVARDNRLLAADASAISFENGSVFQALDLNGNAFGSTGTQNIATFKSGSTYISGDGGNPFGFNQPQSKVTFQAGSNYKHQQVSAPSLAGRTYGNFEWNVSGTVNNNFGSTGTTWTVNGNLVVTSGIIIIDLNGNNQPMNTNVSGNVTIASGASFNFNPAASSALSTFKFNGTTQSINGPGSFVLSRNAIVDVAASTVNMSNISLSIPYILKLSTGTLKTNGNTLTITSDATGTGLVQHVNGNVDGDVTVQRYVAGGTGYRYFSSPFSDASVVDFNDDVLLQGFTGTTSPSAWANLYYYNEAIADVDSMIGWTTPAALSAGNLLGVMQGWALRMNGGVTVDLTGTLNNGAKSRTVTHVSSGRYTADGWNFVGNPYASPIDWDVVANTLPAQIDDAIYYWNPVSEQYVSYVNGASTNGGTKNIASSQAFFVKVNTPGAYSLDMDNTARTTLDPNFYRSTVPHNEYLSLKLDGAGYSDETVVRFSDNATHNFDKHFDAYKRRSSGANVPSLYTADASTERIFAVNTLPKLEGMVSVPMNMEAKVAGSYTITAQQLSNFEPTAFVYLEDKLTGVMQDLREHDVYTFDAAPGDAADRFVIHFYPPVKVASQVATCEGNDAAITIESKAPIAWNAVIVDADGNEVSNQQVMNGTIATNGLAKGTYTLNLSTATGYAVSEVIEVTGATKVTASFVPSILVANTIDAVEFINHTIGATNYTWSFGDGYTSNDMNAEHIYTQAGDYEVVLTADNGECAATYSQLLKVEEEQVISGISNNDVNNMNVFVAGNLLNVRFDKAYGQSLKVDLIDVTGRLLMPSISLDEQAVTAQIELPELANGIYYVKISGNNVNFVKSVFVGH
ncbi:MAG: choice-of-anchor D domain-containing protein [Chitinophagales bacterium]|nr:choice-of-anchor D domain-containing protein [Chitinophagales bacterium]